MRLQGVLAVSLALACGEPPSTDALCESVEAVCEPGGALTVCEDGVRETASCATLCGKDKPVGCLIREGDDACDCGEPNWSCEPDTTGCQGSNWQWECYQGMKFSLPCPDVCQTPDPIAGGCYLDEENGFEGCQCARDGDPCDRDVSACAGNSDMATCIDGVWEVESCADVCGDPDAICGWTVRFERGFCKC